MRLLRDISLISEHVLTPLRCEYEREFELTAAVLRPPVEPTGGEYRMFTVAENTTKQWVFWDFLLQIWRVMMQK